MPSGDLVDEKKLERVRRQIKKLLAKEFPALDHDYDDASRVEVVLVDRSRYWPLGYRPVPYYPSYHEQLTPKQDAELGRYVRDLLISHVSRAADDLARFQRLLQALEVEKKP